uniref:Uncharacterized protein n=1 Tax=Avena sativa TaxID=4498 RepID=A0ACD5TZE8_AVESA
MLFVSWPALCPTNCFGILVHFSTLIALELILSLFLLKAEMRTAMRKRSTKGKERHRDLQAPKLHSSSHDLQHPHPSDSARPAAAMAELGGMLAAAILKVVGDQVGSAIGGQITLQNNFDEDLKKMKMALESVNAVLKAAGRRLITDEPTLLWLKRLKDFMYAITQPSARKCSFKKYLAIMIPCLTIRPKITMANKMEKMRTDLEVITDQHKNFKLTEGPNTNELKVTDIRETSSIMETQIVGRTDDKEEILASLFESMIEDTTILPICGIGGLGKTTLAKMVYNSSQFKEYS